MHCSTAWNGNPIPAPRINPNKEGHNEYVIPKLQKGVLIMQNNNQNKNQNKQNDSQNKNQNQNNNQNNNQNRQNNNQYEQKKNER
jgi:hypothetical protein